jgi:hypothetical protein
MACVEVLHKEIVLIFIEILSLGDEMLFVEAVVLGTTVCSCFGVGIRVSGACSRIFR